MKCGDINNPDGPGHKANGDPCGATVVEGTTRCYQHGGATPAAKVKAETAMALLRLPGIELLYKVLQTLDGILDQFHANTCPTCSYPVGDIEEKEAVIKSCRTVAQTVSAILDRTGLGPRATLEVKQSDHDLDFSQLRPDEKQDLAQLLAQYRATKARIQNRLTGAAFGVPAQPPQDFDLSAL